MLEVDEMRQEISEKNWWDGVKHDMNSFDLYTKDARLKEIDHIMQVHLVNCC